MLLRLLGFVLILAAILFLAAGRWDWLMGWIYMAMYASVTVIGVLAVPLDPELVAERTQIREGVKDWDKRITILGSVLYPLAILIIAGLDIRYGWSTRIPFAIQITAVVVVAVGNLLSIWATAVNKFYGRFVRIQKERGHVVIADGRTGTSAIPDTWGRSFLALPPRWRWAHSGPSSLAACSLRSWLSGQHWKTGRSRMSLMATKRIPRGCDTA
jgi:hypothetical protein